MSDTLVVNEVYLSLQGESTFAGLPCVFIRLATCDLRCSYCDTAYAFTEGSKKSLADIRAEVHHLASPFNRVLEGRARCPSAPRATNSVVIERSRSTSNRAPGQCAPSPEPVSATTPQGSGCKLPLVELTGGEPLLQKNSLSLMQTLCDDGFTVLLETSGAHDLAPVDPRVRRIMDLKCPGSGEVARNRWENLPHLKSTDEIKFVITTREDYAWARERIAEYHLASVCPLLFSWAHPLAPEQQAKSLKQVPPGQTPISRQELAERIIADALPVRFQVQLHKVIWPSEQRGV
jgi:7-carboxy-7-deazaguanine synthase